MTKRKWSGSGQLNAVPCETRILLVPQQIQDKLLVVLYRIELWIKAWKQIHCSRSGDARHAGYGGEQFQRSVTLFPQLSPGRISASMLW